MFGDPNTAVIVAYRRYLELSTLGPESRDGRRLLAAPGARGCSPPARLHHACPRPPATWAHVAVAQTTRPHAQLLALLHFHFSRWINFLEQLQLDSEQCSRPIFFLSAHVSRVAGSVLYADAPIPPTPTLTLLHRSVGADVESCICCSWGSVAIVIH